MKNENSVLIEGRELLRKEISKDRDSSTDQNRIKKLNELLTIPIRTLDELEYVDFLYDNGKLRYESEIKEWNSVKNAMSNFDEIRHKNNRRAFLIPLIVVFIISQFIIRDIIIGPVLGLVFGLIAAIIGSIISYTKNIELAKRLHIPDNDPRVQDEVNKKRGAIIAGIGSAVIIGNHAKKKLKEITNVDGWSEMK